MRCSDYISQTDEDKRGTWSNTFAIKNSRNVRNTEENTIEEVVSSKFFDLEFTKPSYTPFRERFIYFTFLLRYLTFLNLNR